MMGMGSEERNVGSLILALKDGLKPSKASAEDESAEMLKMTAERVIRAIKENDAEMLCKELPKLINNLPSAEAEFEND